MCGCEKALDWGDFINGGRSSPFVVNPYPNPPAPVKQLSDGQWTIQRSGEGVQSSISTFSLSIELIRGNISIQNAGIPALNAPLPLESLPNLTDLRENKWMTATSI